MSIAAQYPGRCPACEERIEVGDLIVTLGESTWAHLDCPEAAPAKPTATCPRCWQALSVTGACGCDL